MLPVPFLISEGPLRTVCPLRPDSQICFWMGLFQAAGGVDGHPKGLYVEN